MSIIAHSVGRSNDNTSSEQVLNNVQDYIRKGWCPLPLPAGEKFPPPAGTTGGSVPALTAERISEIWESWHGDANVGLRMSPSLIGIDVDRAEEFEKFAADHGLSAHGGTVYNTRHGGDSERRHWFFRVPEGINWRSNFPGGEVLRSGHRYSVAYPSVVGGLECRWYLDGAETEIPHVDELPWLPTEWIETLRADHNPAEISERAQSVSLTEATAWLEANTVDFLAAETGPYFSRALESLDFSADGAHPLMTGTQWQFLRQAVKDGTPGLGAALIELEALYVAEVTSRQGDGRLSAGAAENKVSAALRDAVAKIKAQVEAGKLTPFTEIIAGLDWETFAQKLSDGSWLSRPEIMPDAPSTAEDEGLSWGPSDTEAVLSGEAKRRVPEVVKMTDGSHLLYKGKVHNVYAPSETGKSWLMFAAAASILQHGGRVLHIDAEMDVFDCIESLRLLGVPDKYLTTEHYWHIADMDNPAIDAHSVDRWKYLLKAKAWDLVLMDSVGQLMGGMDNNSAAEYREWHRLMPNAARLMGLTVVMIDHISKTQDLQGNIGHPEGTTNKKNQADVTLYLRKVGDGLERGKVGELEILVTKDRFGALKKAGANGYKGFKCRGTFRLDSTNQDRSHWSFVPAFTADVEGVPNLSAKLRRSAALDDLHGSVGEVNVALVTFLDPEGEGVTRKALMEAWETHAPALLEKHRPGKVEKSESGLEKVGQRLKINPGPRLSSEKSQGTIRAMISALDSTR